ICKIPSDCRVAKSVNIALDCYNKKLKWQEAREKVVKDSADLGWFQAPANVAFYIIGWLYGENDFGNSLKIAVNCGDDTDCTAATLGALLGIINGKVRIPSEWIDPIGEKIVTISIDRGSMTIPPDIQTLTNNVVRQTKLTLEQLNADVKIVEEKSDFSKLDKSKLYDKTTSTAICNKSPFAVECDMVHSIAILDYLQTPEISDNEPFNLKLTILNKQPDCKHYDIFWHLPEEWVISPTTSHIMVGHHPPIAEVNIQITPMFLYSSTVRGILEIIPQDRPTVGLIPLLFIRK
ncbi:MAG: ADP-ribosylglycohydrolase family protein, partial [Armatimonadota bacterium]